jgi:hypothetical protein
MGDDREEEGFGVEMLPDRVPDVSGREPGLLSEAAAPLPEAVRSSGGGAAEEAAAVQAFRLGIRPEAARLVAAERLIRSAWPPGE